MSRRLSKNRRLPHTAWNWTADALERRIFLATHPLTSIPVLNSDPGAPATIYLDFHGEPAMTWGQYSVPTTPAYDTDGDPTTFSDTELASIQQIWARVAEAYSPFNINVTTVDPGNWGWGGNHQYRIIIGGSGSWQSSGEGGAAYVGGFAQNYAPDTAFVFSSNLGGSPLYVGDDAVHEGGHGMGLDHQSAYSGTTRTQMYNPGNGTTSPFMGLPWGAPRATWWDGQSELGYNIYQDDLAIISNSTNGFGYRPLLYGQSAGTASVLSVSNNAFSASGIIENTSQQDYFSLSVPNSGSDTFTVNVAQYGAMLHAQLELLNSSGTLITDADSASTLGQSITANLTAGNYYLVVKSYGQYGDIGQYTLSGTLAPAATVVGCYLFYNNSAFDGNDPTLNAADDSAVAPDKQALLPGQTAQFVNISSYSKGINGIMVDIAGLPVSIGLPQAPTLELSDFSFAVSYTPSSNTWSVAAIPATCLVRSGAGVNDSTRVSIAWADGSITNEWIRITVKADADSGLAVPDVFYFGSLIGDSGEAAANGQFIVTAASVAAAAADLHGYLNPAVITDNQDFNRDGKVDATDQLIARNASTNGAQLMQFIAPTSSQTQVALVAADPATTPPQDPHANKNAQRGRTERHRERF